jgi:uncharacterized beta-barrel protein YwiB (DUF1934 family)
MRAAKAPNRNGVTIMEQKIKIKLTSRRREISNRLLKSLFESALGEEQDDRAEELFADHTINTEEDVIEMNTEGVLRLEDGRVEIAYEESELTGMEGANTSVSFTTEAPQLVTMMRGGTVTTALVFEPRRRHICAYHTPFMPFEICVYASCVDNRLLQDGILELDYIIEIRGAQAERTRFTMEIRTADEADPLPRPEIMLKNLQ